MLEDKHMPVMCTYPLMHIYALLLWDVHERVDVAGTELVERVLGVGCVLPQLHCLPRVGVQIFAVPARSSNVISAARENQATAYTAVVTCVMQACQAVVSVSEITPGTMTRCTG